MAKEKQWWYFLIKPNTKHRKKYFKIFNTFERAKREANKRYHNDWNVQLAEEMWNALQEGKGIEQFVDEKDNGTEQGKTI